MANVLDRDGCFLANIVDTKVCEAESGSCSLYARFAIVAIHEGNDVWSDWTSYDIETEGDFYFRLKDGSISESKVRDICNATGWSGLLPDWDNGNIPQRTVMIFAKKDEYKGKIRYKADVIRRADGSTVLGRQGVASERLSALQQEIGGAVRSFVPAAPFKPVSVPTFAAAPPPANDIPF